MLSDHLLFVCLISSILSSSADNLSLLTIQPHRSGWSVGPLYRCRRHTHFTLKALLSSDSDTWDICNVHTLAHSYPPRPCCSHFDGRVHFLPSQLHPSQWHTFVHLSAVHRVCGHSLSVCFPCWVKFYPDSTPGFSPLPALKFCLSVFLSSHKSSASDRQLDTMWEKLAPGHFSGSLRVRHRSSFHQLWKHWPIVVNSKSSQPCRFEPLDPDTQV